MIERLRARLARAYPATLSARVTLMLVVALLCAEVFAGALWYYQYRQQLRSGLDTTLRSMTQNAGATLSFMNTLPRNYRQLVLTQQRKLGGTQFFTSINRQPLTQANLDEAWLQREIITLAKRELEQMLGGRTPYRVHLVRSDELRVFNSGVKMRELPEGWAHFAIPATRDDAPMLVMQLQLPTREWLFLAAPMPAPYDQPELPFLTERQLTFTVFGLGLVLLFVLPWLRREMRPLEALSSAAATLNSHLESPQVDEQGSAEFVTAIRAFNQMQIRLRNYLRNRAMLFSGISHDLKTPLTRLRLRMEMLEDSTLQAKFARDINELELMVKGALQSMKDTDIHENAEDIDLMHWLGQLCDSYAGQLSVLGQLAPFRGWPLALRRCIGNVIDNGIKYGGQVEVVLVDSSEQIVLHISDQGPGIPEHEHERVFAPYYRLHDDQQGSGLGLAIARNIARNHGGELSLRNRPGGGLIATLALPRRLPEEEA